MSYIIVEGVGSLYLFERRYDEALRHLEAAKDIDPQFYKPYAGMGRALFLRGETERAIELLERFEGGGLMSAGNFKDIPDADWLTNAAAVA